MAEAKNKKTGKANGESAKTATADGQGEDGQGTGETAPGSAGGAGAPAGAGGASAAGSQGQAGADGKSADEPAQDGSAQSAGGSGTARTARAGAASKEKSGPDKELVTRCSIAALTGYVSRTGSYGIDDPVDRAIKVGKEMAEALENLED